MLQIRTPSSTLACAVHRGIVPGILPFRRGKGTTKEESFCFLIYDNYLNLVSRARLALISSADCFDAASTASAARRVLGGHDIGTHTGRHQYNNTTTQRQKGEMYDDDTEKREPAASTSTCIVCTLFISSMDLATPTFYQESVITGPQDATK